MVKIMVNNNITVVLKLLMNRAIKAIGNGRYDVFIKHK